MIGRGPSPVARGPRVALRPLALDKHAGRNARRASERAAAKDALEELEVKEVRRAIAETSLLRVDAPVFVPRAFPAP